MNNIQTTRVTFPDNHAEDMVLIPVNVFKKLERERNELEQMLRRQKELVETLELIRTGEEEFLSGNTTTEPVSSLMS